jgi:hypothetical protein
VTFTFWPIMIMMMMLAANDGSVRLRTFLIGHWQPNHAPEMPPGFSSFRPIPPLSFVPRYLMVGTTRMCINRSGSVQNVKVVVP